MELKYLKVEPGEAITSLNALIVSGYQLKDKLVSEYRQIPKILFVKKTDKRIISEETRSGWTKLVTNWVIGAFRKLEELYISPSEAYKFKEAHALPLSNTEFDDRFYGQLLKLQARIEILDSYISFIFSHTSIQIVAGRDAVVQINGMNNKQEVKHEG